MAKKKIIETIEVPELGIEVEIPVYHREKSFKEIMRLSGTRKKRKAGWRLLSACREKDSVNELAFLANSPKYAKILKMNGTSANHNFFIEQTFNVNKKNDLVAAEFGSSLGCVYLFFYWTPGSKKHEIGVRFCRDLPKKKIHSQLQRACKRDITATIKKLNSLLKK